MASLMSCEMKDIVTMFNDELQTFIIQLMHIAEQINMTKKEMSTILSSKRDLETGMKINQKLCIDLYAKFLFEDGHETFVENVKCRNYDYFYELVKKETIDDEFKELLQIVVTVSYNLDDDLKNDIFGYLENITDLAITYAAKLVENK